MEYDHWTCPSLWCWCDPSRTRHMYTTYTASSRWCIMLFLLQNRHGDGTCSKSLWVHCIFACFLSWSADVFCRWDANKKQKNLVLQTETFDHLQGTSEMSSQTLMVDHKLIPQFIRTKSNITCWESVCKHPWHQHLWCCNYMLHARNLT